MGKEKSKPNKKHKMVVVVVLFYIYTPLKALTDLESTFKTCTSDHSITGRLLISTEGINGTIAATPTSIKTFQDFFTKLIPAAINMQWKRSETSETPFIDMKIKIAKELVGWGFKEFNTNQIDVVKPVVEHLSPAQFHHILINNNNNNNKTSSTSSSNPENVIILDIRNQQESSLGHFENAILPQAKNMPDLGRFLKEQAQHIQDKTVLLYCTGGIRCEKASHYLNTISNGSAKHIYQLEGGIHEYLEEYSTSKDCQFIGSNFVFDKRGSYGKGKLQNRHGTTVGLCQECHTNEPNLIGCAVCVVCRFQLLLCTECLPLHHGEHFCFSHQQLLNGYSKFAIPTFNSNELETRIALLKEKEKELLVQGKNGRAKRRTIRKCYLEMENVLLDKRKVETGVENEKNKDVDTARTRNESSPSSGDEMISFCRASGKLLNECDGCCWGFFGKNANDTKKDVSTSSHSLSSALSKYTIRIIESDQELSQAVDVINQAFETAYQHVRPSLAPPPRTTDIKVKNFIENNKCKLWICVINNHNGTNNTSNVPIICGTVMVPSPHLDFETAVREDTESFGSLAVLPSMQRQGIGNMLLNRVEKNARSNGKKRLECCFAHGKLLNNKPKMFEFYNKLGFKKEDRKERVSWFDILPEFRNGLYFQQMVKTLK